MMLSELHQLTREQLREQQLRNLRWSLKRVWDRVPHYRQAFESAGVRPEDLHRLEDLQHFPLTEKDHLRRNYPFGLFAVPRSEVVRIHASSGTTGKPTVVGYTRSDIDTWSNLMARSIAAAGGRPGDMIHVAYGYGLFTGGLGAHYGGERLGCTVIPMSGGQTPRQVQLIADFDPDIIMVTPSYLLNLADEMDRQGVDAASLKLRIAILGAEPWTNAMREEIESRLQLSALNIYGLSEVMGPGVAQEYSETRDGLVIWEDHFYPEIIDPTSGKVLADGEPGELVLTSLSKEAFPVIRYRTRDLTRLLSPTAFNMRRMDRIMGRSDDMLIIRGVNVFPSQIEEQLFRISGLAPHYQLILEREGALDRLTVTVEAVPGIDRHESDNAGRALADAIKSMIGVSAVVDVREPGGVPRSEGKAQRVIDQRQQGSFGLVPE